jgi:hypothetical protein
VTYGGGAPIEAVVTAPALSFAMAAARASLGDNTGCVEACVGAKAIGVTGCTSLLDELLLLSPNAAAQVLSAIRQTPARTKDLGCIIRASFKMSR